MKNRKINVDRPQLTGEEIMARKNFEAIVRNHQVMSKPFYKQSWFFGTTGLASLGLIIGGTFAFQSSDEEDQLSSELLNTEAPPNFTIPDNNYIVATSKFNETTNELTKKTIQINPLNISPIEENFTLEEQQSVAETETNEEGGDLARLNSERNEMLTQDSNPVFEEKADDKPFSRMDMYPRISSKMGGGITRNELLDNKGITTEGDVSIIHFELHLIDGLGGKVFTEESNQLNQEMKDALENIGQGETIYFENIRGKVKNGAEVRLNPLRYVLMN